MQYMDNYRKWLKDFASDKALVQDLAAISGNEKEIEDRFYTGLSFGTGGMRGVLGYGTNRMNVYTVRRATQGLSDILNAKSENPVVIVAYDSRRMSPEFAMEAVLTLCANGIRNQDVSTRCAPCRSSRSRCGICTGGRGHRDHRQPQSRRSITATRFTARTARSSAPKPPTRSPKRRSTPSAIPTPKP